MSGLWSFEFSYPGLAAFAFIFMASAFNIWVLNVNIRGRYGEMSCGLQKNAVATAKCLASPDIKWRTSLKGVDYWIPSFSVAARKVRLPIAYFVTDSPLGLVTASFSSLAAGSERKSVFSFVSSNQLAIRIVAALLAVNLAWTLCTGAWVLVGVFAGILTMLFFFELATTFARVKKLRLEIASAFEGRLSGAALIGFQRTLRRTRYYFTRKYLNCFSQPLIELATMLWKADKR